MILKNCRFQIPIRLETKLFNRELVRKNHLIYILEIKSTSKMFLCLSILTYVCLETKFFREDSGVLFYVSKVYYVYIDFLNLF
ncbi:hypothetical protein LEP1GSC172_0996 [Leptospira noguchii]|uniref:Uncharacterized protein n=2 Tax=Leptospira noguchii TaxID=28182 RepID=T0FTP3_9LEPT|nr:hypothetical protein LEP1GSC172_0996 [Leptospira noguchii]EQA72925.1 hypothetical protein LEP1GSC059_1504 [Leptospira noguchii serovar Panama str. CZ214]